MMDAKTDEIILKLDRLTAWVLQQAEVNQLGHRIHYDKNGRSTNVPGNFCDPRFVNEHGMMDRLVPKNPEATDAE